MQKKPFTPPQEKTHDLGSEGPIEFKDVLMLEDDSGLTEILKSYLEANHFRVVCVQNGVDGLRKIMAMDFDVIICDMLMPNLPGDMFYLAVERTKPHLCKRFIFMTGHKGDRKIDDFIRKVRGVMLWKPFAPQDLVDMVNVVVRRTSSGEMF